MKKLYWIDDNFAAMDDVMRNSFPELWEIDKENGISNCILLLGNEYMPDNISFLYGEREEKECIEEVKSYFFEVCTDFDQTYEDRKTYLSHKNLVEDPIRMVFKSCDEEEKNKIYGNLLNWVKLENESQDTNSLMDQVIDVLGIDQSAVVGIDILIWKGDMDKIYNKRMIFSLELYHQLKSKGYKCFLYSSNANDIELVRNCKEMYAEKFKEAQPEVIFLRADLTKKGNTEVTGKIKEMFQETGRS